MKNGSNSLTVGTKRTTIATNKETKCENDIRNRKENPEIKKQILSLCSYNINGLHNKLNCPYFIDFLDSFDVFFCLETHVFQSSKLSQINKYFPNHNLHWKLADKRYVKGRGIAGLLIGWKSILVSKKKLKFEVTEDGNLTILQIHKNTEKITLIPLYLRRESWKSEFEELRQHILINGTSNLILIGDLNIRIGELQQELVAHLHNCSRILSIRHSEDKMVDGSGKDFMEMCDDFNLRILNGAFEGDKTGSFTYSSALGNSVNDLAAVSNTIIKQIKRFTVVEAIWSDHFPINILLELDEKNVSTTTNNLIPKLWWDKSKQQSYCNKLDRLIENRLEEYYNLNDIGQIIKKSAMKQNIRKKIKKNPWFDKECEIARKQSFKKLSEWKIECNKELKEHKKLEYRLCNRSYNTLIKAKQEI